MGLLRGDLLSHCLLKFLSQLDWRVVSITPGSERFGFERLQVELVAVGDHHTGSIDLGAETQAQKTRLLQRILLSALEDIEEGDTDDAADHIRDALRDLGFE